LQSGYCETLDTHTITCLKYCAFFIRIFIPGIFSLNAFERGGEDKLGEIGRSVRHDECVEAVFGNG
jgi:hypothetical protein